MRFWSCLIFILTTTACESQPVTQPKTITQVSPTPGSAASPMRTTAQTTVLEAPADIQNVQSDGSDAKIESKYDRFKNETTIQIKPILVYGERPNGIYAWATLKHRGKDISEDSGFWIYPRVTFAYLSIGKNRRFQYERSWINLINGAQSSEYFFAYEERPLEATHIEALVKELSETDFAQIVEAHNLEVQLNEAEFSFTAEQRAPLVALLAKLRELISKAPKPAPSVTPTIAPAAAAVAVTPTPAPCYENGHKVPCR